MVPSISETPPSCFTPLKTPSETAEPVGSTIEKPNHGHRPHVGREGDPCDRLAGERDPGEAARARVVEDDPEPAGL